MARKEFVGKLLPRSITHIMIVQMIADLSQRPEFLVTILPATFIGPGEIPVFSRNVSRDSLQRVKLPLEAG